LDFFVGRLKLFIGRFVPFLDGLKIVARLGQLDFEFGDATAGALVWLEFTFALFALLMAARSGSIKPSRAIFSTSKLALPVDGGGFVEGRIHPGMIAEEKKNFVVAVFFGTASKSGLCPRRSARNFAPALHFRSDSTATAKRQRRFTTRRT
jgi:hypothetical protein